MATIESYQSTGSATLYAVRYDSDDVKAKYAHSKAKWDELLPTLRSLPLIVLAGLP
jgi:hypothetical protein